MLNAFPTLTEYLNVEGYLIRCGYDEKCVPSARIDHVGSAAQPGVAMMRATTLYHLINAGEEVIRPHQSSNKGDCAKPRKSARAAARNRHTVGP
jgi:hypothetical protein